MILEFKKYALLALLFVGFASVSPASVGDIKATQLITSVEQAAEELYRLYIYDAAFKYYKLALECSLPLDDLISDIKSSEVDEAECIVVIIESFHKGLRDRGLEGHLLNERLEELLSDTARSISFLEDYIRLPEATRTTVTCVKISPSMSCKVCSEPKEKLNICSGCRLVSYCSQECQKADWLAHKNFCKKHPAKHLAAKYLAAASKK